ncbi:MAG: hypothetical protein M1820_003961 [Bogoriella megaspora]|nr:MAG: hypothetical protein M1820_003961 [Bogoriella megaspora]
MKNLFSLACLLGVHAINQAIASPIAGSREDGLRTVHQFPSRTWIENMAIRKNGQILGTDLAGGRIFLVDPKHPHDPPVIAQFPNGTAVGGIAEVEDDVFYTSSIQTIAGNVYSFNFQPNSSAVWEVDMRCYSRTGKAEVRKVVDIPAAVVLNGMTLLSKEEGTILMADAVAGLIWKLNVNTAAYEVAIDDPILKPIPTARPPFGVNGIHIVDSLLYFSNTNHGLVAKVPISSDGGLTGSVSTISSEVPNVDDFAVDRCGAIWLAENQINTFSRVSPTGEVQKIAGGQNSTELIGPVAAIFGRTGRDRDVLYISTDGLTNSATGEPLTTNGKIAAIDTWGW